MSFNVFERLSELETTVFVLEKEIYEKNILMQSLIDRNHQLERELLSLRQKVCTDSTSDHVLSTVDHNRSIAKAGETSEASIHQSKYTYDDSTGLFFDSDSGYYYDPESSLFFDPQTGNCCRYDYETREYKHCHPADLRNFPLMGESSKISQPVHGSQRSPQDSQSRITRDALPHDLRPNSSSHNSHQESSYPSPIKSSFSEECTQARNRNDVSSITPSLPTSLTADPIVYLPHVRLVVLASEYTVVGSVFNVTNEDSSCGRGCIGRNPTFCPSVNFPDDPSVAAIHCEVIYDIAEKKYLVMDRQSSSGTFLNGQILPKTKPIELCHGDILRVGTTRLLIHIHRNSQVCAQCDPGMLQLALGNEGTKYSSSETAGSAEADPPAPADRSNSRRANLKLLKEKYGIRYLCSARPNVQYTDRAAQRRALQNIEDVRCETRQVISMAMTMADPSIQASHPAMPIGAENRGAQLLLKMGWKNGVGLGKDSSGIVEPIPLSIRPNPLAGLGFEPRGRIN